MIGKLTGIVDYIDSDHLILDVNSVGYVVFCSNKFLSNLEAGTKISLFIETQFREDGTYLYGFENLQLKSQFLLLTTVKGVGAKLALSILSQMTLEDISNAILLQDKTSFRNVTGVGPKLAERIILELKGKNVDMNFSTPIENTISYGIRDDAISALINLGVSKPEAYSAISTILLETPDIKIDQLITLALRRI